MPDVASQRPANALSLSNAKAELPASVVPEANDLPAAATQTAIPKNATAQNLHVFLTFSSWHLICPIVGR
jgi:hypothetical protein